MVEQSFGCSSAKADNFSVLMCAGHYALGRFVGGGFIKNPPRAVPGTGKIQTQPQWAGKE